MKRGFLQVDKAAHAASQSVEPPAAAAVPGAIPQPAPRRRSTRAAARAANARLQEATAQEAAPLQPVAAAADDSTVVATDTQQDEHAQLQQGQPSSAAVDNNR